MHCPTSHLAAELSAALAATGDYQRGARVPVMEIETLVERLVSLVEAPITSEAQAEQVRLLSGAITAMQLTQINGHMAEINESLNYIAEGMTDLSDCVHDKAFRLSIK